MIYRVKMTWDDEARVWIATSDDVPGLVLESGSFDALIERLRLAIPEMVAMNGKASREYQLDYTINRSDRVLAYG